MTPDLCFTPARTLAHLIRTRQVSAREVMQAFLAQIARLNPSINALVAKAPDSACLALADEADRRLQHGDEVGLLHGLPMAFKDAEPAVGFPCTQGSLIFEHHMPTVDSTVVQRLRRAGVIPIGKTNVSEFTMGSHTYNRVYGTTVNPYDRSKSAGGSSGGAAAAVAAGMLPAADGSDLGGSLRNPANFNNLVALRPTIGLVPNWPSPASPIEFLAKGAIARTVDDAALLMRVLADADVRGAGSSDFDPPLQGRFAGTRIAWCPDLGGLPLEQRLREVLHACRQVFESLGCVVEDIAPDLHEADEIFLTVRSFASAATLGPLLETHRAHMKPEAVWQIERGRQITPAQLAAAVRAHAALLERTRRFQQTYPFIVCAVNQVAPFDARLDWPHEIDGTAMEHYIAWMKSTYWISTLQVPALSVPAGFTPDGLPVGIQIVGRAGDDRSVLALGQGFEAATKFWQRRPPGC